MGCRIEFQSVEAAMTKNDLVSQRPELCASRDGRWDSVVGGGQTGKDY